MVPDGIALALEGKKKGVGGAVEESSVCVCVRERERERDGTGVNLSFVGKGRAGGRNGVLIDCTHTPTYLMYGHTYIHALGDLNEITP